MIPLLLALALCIPTPATDDGCAGYCVTLPSACEARYALDYVTTRLPVGPTCDAVEPGLWRCRYWSRPTAISCACFENETPPPGQVWMRSS